MTDRPILFSAPMIRAILDGRKTQTRRVLKPQPHPGLPIAGAEFVSLGDDPGRWCWLNGFDGSIVAPFIAPCAIGDRLWVREKWRIGAWREDGRVALDYGASGPSKTPWLAPGIAAAEPLIEASREDVFRSNDIQVTNGIATWEPGHGPCRWRPSIHMPRWASRLTLTVTGVRFQRVQDISEADAMAEGFDWHPDPVGAFHLFWDDLNARRGYSWDVNPWVIARTFTAEQRNIDR